MGKLGRGASLSVLYPSEELRARDSAASRFEKKKKKPRHEKEKDQEKRETQLQKMDKEVERKKPLSSLNLAVVERKTFAVDRPRSIPRKELDGSLDTFARALQETPSRTHSLRRVSQTRAGRIESFRRERERETVSGLDSRVVF